MSTSARRARGRSLDVIVIHHADACSTRSCVRETSRQLELLAIDGVAAGVIVVDNGPTGEVVDLAEGDGVDVVPAPRRQGFGANADLGVANSDADLVLLLNDDARIDARSITALAEVVEGPDVGIAGPRILDADGRPSPSAWRFPSISGVAAFALRQDGPPWVQSAVERTSAVDVLSGAVMMIRRETFIALGGFDPAFFMFSEDADLCRRLADRGLLRLIIPAANATHAGQASTAAHERRRDIEQWRSRSTYWRKHHAAPAILAIRAIYAAAYASGALVALAKGGGGAAARVRARRLLFLSGCAVRTPRGPGLRELAADWGHLRGSSAAPGPGIGV